ncbi:DUF11 domain-containing protein [Chiayiivirga flava]|uniref:Putative repeat protein (TIGR01451 family) n=1 Tax=Chiayiivirga flava TaxID=659595 RepID=A0A7W8D4L0_9GAMM|nr:DUF11 domain-containing protein [Chiayiivirga flava]MBB5207432.1 putative repeat protein (TIGR01451 family) [Chiayiivirga flava]
MRIRSLLSGWLLAPLVLLCAGAVQAEGSRSLYPATYPAAGAYPAGGFRANLDMDGSGAYAGIIERRQFLYLYVQAGEYIALGSRNRSNGGDIFVYDPQDFGQRGAETVPGTADFTCSGGAIGGAAGPHYSGGTLGTIATRAQELAGPNSADNTVTVPNGFAPCAYRAPVTGVYGVRFTPATTGAGPDGVIDPPAVSNTTVAAWDVSVRADATSTASFDGRLFTYAWAGWTGGNSRSIHHALYYVTTDGYRYEQTAQGLDPNGFALYANSAGFLDQGSPLYKNIRGSNQVLAELRPVGITGVSAQRPQYPVFFSDVRDGGPNEAEVERTLAALGIPLAPTPPQVTDVAFNGNLGGITSTVNAGGTFTFSTIDTLSYQIVISRDSVDFDPANVLNRVITGAALGGDHIVIWDGLDNSGNPFPEGSYEFELSGRNGEVHFPLIDAEGNANGGPTVVKLNGPSAGSGTVYFDDRGYVTRSNFAVGTLNGHLCGAGNTSLQPTPTHSLVGIDSTAGGPNTFARRWAGNTNNNADCTNTQGFGDGKGLDLWTYESVAPAREPVVIVPAAEGVDVGTLASVSATVLPGDTAYGTFVFSNNGEDPAAGVTYSVTLGNPAEPDTCPATVNFSLVPAGVTATWNPAPLCTITFTGMPTTLASGESLTFNFDYVVGVANPGPIPLVTTIAATNETPGAPSPNTANAVTVVPSIDAVDDDFTGTPFGPGGGTTPSVFDNDTLNDAPFADGEVSVTIEDIGGLVGVTVNPDGTLDVPPGTPPGTYTITYEICSVAIPTLCDTATATVFVGSGADPLVCDGTFYQVRQLAGGSRLFLLDRSSNPYVAVEQYNAGVTLNAMGYNSADDHLYALLNPTTAGNALYRLGAGGVVDLNGAAAGVAVPVAGLPNAAYDGGAFDGAGRYFVSQSAGPMFRIDNVGGIAPTPTAQAVATVADAAPPAGYTGSATFVIGDIAARPGESTAALTVLYGVRQDQAGTVFLYRFAISAPGSAAPTAAVSRIATNLPLTTFGSVFFDTSGTFYVYDNSADATAGFYAVDVATGIATNVSGSDSASSSDGGSCAFTAQTIDVVKAAGAVAPVNATTFDVPYSLVVGNLGGVPVPNVQVSDNLANTYADGAPTLAIVAGPTAAAPCTVNPGFDGVSDFALLAGLDTLAPGASCAIDFTVRVSYASAADIPLGTQENTAYASSTSGAGPNPGYSYPGGAPLPPVSLIAADESTDGPALPTDPDGDLPSPTPVLFPAPGIAIDKSSNSASIPALPATITYTFLVSNTGNVDLTSPGVNDALCDAAPLLGGGDDGDGVLEVGEVFTYTCSHAVTQAEFNAGTLLNTATASGTPPGGAPPLESPPDSTTTTFVPAPGIAIDKTSDSASIPALPATITYTFLVGNTGNVDLTSPGVNDALCDAPPVLVGGDDGDGVLEVGEVFTYSCSHAVTQGEFNAGSLLNTATATGTPPTGGPIDSPPDSTTTTFVVTPGIAIDKSSDSASIDALPATIAYTFLVSNTGNVDLTAPGVNDALCDAAPVLTGGDDGDGVLEVGEVFTYTCSHAVTLAEFEAPSGTLVNTATASGTPPTGGPIESPPDSTTTTFDQDAAIAIVKTSDTSTLSALPATIVYTFAVSNAGNVALATPAVNDALCDAAPVLSGGDDGDGVLEVGEVFTYTCSHAVTQAEFDTGSLINTATASGVPPSGVPIESPPDSTTTTFVPAPGIALVKTSDTATLPALPATIVYTFVASNTGNVTLSAPSINDALCDAPAVYVSGDTDGDTALGVGEAFTFTCSHAVTQAEFDVGSLVNTATASGTPPGGGPPLESPPDSTTTTFVPAPGIALAKTSDSATVTALPATIVYSFVVSNTGNVTLADPSIDDALCDAQATYVSGDVDGDTALGVGEAFTFTCSHAVTQTEFDTGSLVNTATASGTPPGGGPPLESPPDSTTTTFEAGPALAVVKTRTDAIAPIVAGSVLTYRIVATNTGNVSLDEVTVSDALIADLICEPVLPATLAVGASVTCTGSYTVTQDDVDGGDVTNTASASGIPPGGTPVDDSDEIVTPIPPAPALELTKTATLDDGNGSGAADAGETIDYAIAVRNTGNVTLTGLVVVDPMGGGTLACAPNTLAPDAVATCDAYSYVVTDADVIAGTPIVNTATGTAQPPTGTPVSDEDDTSTPVGDALADLAILKTGPARSNVGDEVAFTIVVTNLGPNTAVDTLLVDPTPAGLQFVANSGDCATAFPCELGDLAVGDTRTVVSTFLLPDDYSGPDTIVNIASVTSSTPDPTPGDTSSSASTLIGSAPVPVPSPAVIPVDARWATLLLALAMLLLAGPQLRRRG